MKIFLSQVTETPQNNKKRNMQKGRKEEGRKGGLWEMRVWEMLTFEYLLSIYPQNISKIRYNRYLNSSQHPCPNLSHIWCET